MTRASELREMSAESHPLIFSIKHFAKHKIVGGPKAGYGDISANTGRTYRH